jgi:hypothetical protein
VRIDDLAQQADKIYANWFFPTSVVSDIDVFYATELPGSYTFTIDSEDVTESLYVPPVVSGVVGDTAYSVAAIDSNDIEGFWYTCQPDRISVTTSVIENHLLASGRVQDSPLPILTNSGLAHVPNRLYITVSGGDTYVELQDQQIIRYGLVQLHGVSREGLEVSEQLPFLHDETQSTIYDYESLNPSGVSVYGVDPNTATVSVMSAQFNMADYPVNYNLDETVNREEMALSWGLGVTVSGYSTLDLRRYYTDDLELRMSGFSGKYAWFRQELLDTAGGRLVLNDIAIEPYSNRVWGVSNDTLYIFSTDTTYFDLSVLDKKDYDAASVIEPSSYYVLLGEDVELDYVWKRPTVGMLKHRVWVQKPDGNKFSLEDGIEVTYHTDASSWVFGEPTMRQIRASETYTTTQRGQYLYCLEVAYTDDTTSIDKRVVSVISKQAVAEYSVSSLGMSSTALGIDFDSEYKLWIMDANGTKYQLGLHYDIMILDYNRKIVYFREGYDQVRVY